MAIPTLKRIPGKHQWQAGYMSLAPDSDEQLMLAYAAGDIAAFDRLYQNHRAALYRFILRQLKDPVSSNDIYQLCWEKVIKGRQRYSSNSPFSAWLFRIARNTVIDHFRRQASIPGHALPDLPSDQPGPEETALEYESANSLAEAIDSLPLDQREVVLLRLEAGLDLATIADLTGVNAETCKSRLRYALDKLKLQMQERPEPAGEPHVRR